VGWVPKQANAVAARRGLLGFRQGKGTIWQLLDKANHLTLA
jgi:hypothetical protein